MSFRHRFELQQTSVSIRNFAKLQRNISVTGMGDNWINQTQKRSDDLLFDF